MKELYVSLQLTLISAKKMDRIKQEIRDKIIGKCLTGAL